MVNNMTVSPSHLYSILHHNFGKQDWWPIDIEYHNKNNSDSRFEIIVGAILTQNTAWRNVEKALNNLKTKKLLNLKKILKIDLESLKIMIQPSGFFNQKAMRLKNFANFLNKKYSGNFDRLFDNNLLEIRNELLSLNGIGKETADSILLYAGNFPIFVIDSYTKRISKRIPVSANTKLYEALRLFFENKLKEKYSEGELVNIYKELHSLIVELAKNYCKNKPNCNNCVLSSRCLKII